MSDSVDNLGAIVKAARIKASLTLYELASKLSITQRHLISIENNERNPSYDLLYRLIRTLSLPADRIFIPNRHMAARSLIGY